MISNNKLFLYDENTLLKYSKIDKEVWKYLRDKGLSFINAPIKEEKLTEEEQRTYQNCNSKIYLPYLKDYEILSEETFLKDFNTKDILILEERIIYMIKELHKNDIYHSDINLKNIMINKDLNIKIIDLWNIQKKNNYKHIKKSK